MNKKIIDHIRGQVWDQVLGDQVWIQAWDQVEDQVWNQVRGQVWDHINNITEV